MADDTAKLIAIVEANTKQFENALKRIEKTVNNTFKGGAANTRTLERAMVQTAATTDKLNQALNRAKATATGFAGSLALPISSLGAALVVKQVIDYADAWNIAGNKLAAASEIAGRQARSLEEVNKIATETRSGLVQTVDLYSKLLRATGTLAATEEQVAQATETVNKAFKAGGAAASEQAAGILQLSQGLASGILQGDELRSIRENAPVIAAAIAKEFNTTIGGLKALGAAGELSAKRIFKAILAAQEEVDKAFGVTEVTVADAVSQLQNSFIQFIGNLDDTTGATGALVEQLQLAADGFDRLGAAARALRADKEIGELFQELTDFLLLTDSTVGRIKKLSDAEATAASRTEDLVEALDDLKRKLGIVANHPAVIFQLKEIEILLGKKTPEAIEQAQDAFNDFVKSAPGIAGLTEEFTKLIAEVVRLNDEAAKAAKTLTGSFALEKQTSVEDFVRQKAFDKAQLIFDRDQESAQSEFDRKLEQKTDEVVEAFEKLGETITRAAAKVIAVRELDRAATADFTAKNVQSTADFIESLEGLILTARLDKSTSGTKDAFRVGVGSDTRMLPSGESVTVQPGDTTTEALARRELDRRIGLFQADIVETIGSAFGQFTAPVQAALTSVAYNYGKLPPSVAAAARTGDTETVARAVESLPINPDRRAKEAALIRTGEFGLTEKHDTATQAMEKERKATEDLNQAKLDFEALLKREGETIKLEISNISASTAEQEYAAKKQELLNKLTADGIPITKEYAAAIEDIARASAARVTAEEIRDSNEKQEQDALQSVIDRADAIRDVASDVLGGLASDLANGVKPAEALANALGKIAQKLIDIGINSLVSGLFGPQGTSMGGIFGGVFGGGTQTPLIQGGLTGLAHGGIMTSRGQMPLKRYGSGGVAHGPQMALFGEGSTPEAYVPLPDGRSIPVRMKIPSLMGGRGGGGRQRVDTNVVVSLKPSPEFIGTVEAISREREESAVRRGPAYAADRQRRVGRPGG